MVSGDAGTLEVQSVGKIAGEFFVPAYQRGYRWTTQEVGQLLDDIAASDGNTYYLQPVVVKRRDDGSWELVDGQQRLTTLYLLLRYLQETHLPTLPIGYSITYETRPGSKAYLEQLDEHAARNNIDFFHLFHAHRCIVEWFERRGDAITFDAMRLYGYLFDSVKVLWYEAPEDVDPNDLFRRLNIGQIRLTDAELVKALLLSQGREGSGQTDRALEMAAHWDLIERELRVPEVWAFVTGQSGEEDDAATHISLLLDTLAEGNRESDRLPFVTFESLRPLIQGDPQEFWRDVVELHSRVLGWYADRTLFHKVGYLIAVGQSFADLVEISKGNGRSAFERALDDKIRSHLGLTAGAVRELTFNSRGRRTSDVLLLMNVETIRHMTDSFERYSFRAHAAGHWSIEHIHAQNADPLNTVEQWQAWLEYHRDALADLPHLDEDRRANLIDRIDEVLAAGVTKQTFGLLEQAITAVFSPADEPTDDVDSIANLALLDQRDNSAFNNSVFEVKRRAMIQRDKVGSYIPACTRKVFLKYYTESGAHQLYFWSAGDRQAYLNALLDEVGPYLLPEEDGP